MRRLFVAALAIAATLSAGCGSSAAPAPLPHPAPQISCVEPPFVVPDVIGTTQAVSFPAPIVSGGAPPVTVTCSPASGTEFPLGNTIVSCTATDAQRRQAGCAFTVTLRHRTLAISRIVAFGDSITAGENGRPFNGIAVIDLPNAYPTFLQRYFSDRLPAQQVTVENAGLSGEKAVDNDGRLKSVIARHQPDVLLLLEGINDLNAGESPERVTNALRDSIDTARDRGVRFVFVSTLLPVAPEICGAPPPRCRALDTPEDVIIETNREIRSMVAAAGGHLVDPYELFNANRAAFIDVDGLHLRPEGNRALATAFWDRLVQVIPAQLLGR